MKTTIIVVCVLLSMLACSSDEAGTSGSDGAATADGQVSAEGNDVADSAVTQDASTADTSQMADSAADGHEVITDTDGHEIIGDTAGEDADGQLADAGDTSQMVDAQPDTSDTAVQPDTGIPGDGTADAGANAPPSLEIVTSPSGSQRGPVAVAYQVDDPEGDTIDVTVRYLIGSTAESATALDGLAEPHTGIQSPAFGQDRSFVWDSLADVTTNAQNVKLGLQPCDAYGCGPEVQTDSFDLLNGGEARDRLVLAAHRISDTALSSVLLLRKETGELEDTQQTLQLPAPPVRAIFHPSGLKALLLCHDQYNYRTALQVVQVGANQQLSLETAQWFEDTGLSDARFSPGGLAIFALNSNILPDGALLRLSFPLSETEILRQIFVPTALELMPLRKQMVVAAAGGAEHPGSIKLLRLDFEGALLTEILIAGQLTPERIDIDPAERFLVVPDPWGSQVTVVRIPEEGLQVHQIVDGIPNPTDVLILDDVNLVLVSTLDYDNIVALSYTDDSLAFTISATIGPVPLSTFMDRVSGGPWHDLVLVSSVTEIARLNASGSIIELLAPFSLGSGMSNIVDDVAIQP